PPLSQLLDDARCDNANLLPGARITLCDQTAKVFVDFRLNPSDRMRAELDRARKLAALHLVVDGGGGYPVFSLTAGRRKMRSWPGVFSVVCIACLSNWAGYPIITNASKTTVRSA